MIAQAGAPVDFVTEAKRPQTCIAKIVTEAILIVPRQKTGEASGCPARNLWSVRKIRTKIRNRLSQSVHPTRVSFEMLEPCEGKLSRTVLRGERGGNTPDLPGV